uniref:Leucine zipper protein 2 n=1 Tax=Serinus canaria TaxID=9135 RepID=A0A8C9N1J3_SERCA
ALGNAFYYILHWQLERQLKEVFKERSNLLQQLLKTSKELQGIKVNLQSLKNDEASTKSDVQKLLELGQNQREVKSLQEAFQKQLNEAAEKAEKQQATINFLKTEMERKSRMIRDLQNENKSLKNKLLSGNKLCGMHAEESKKIQAQLKELRYGKKDLIFKAQQLTDLEQKLSVAKDKLENAALDKESQLKALKETVQLCLSSVQRSQPAAAALASPKPAGRLSSPSARASRAPLQGTSTKVWFHSWLGLFLNILSCKTIKLRLRRISHSTELECKNHGEHSDTKIIWDRLCP